ncbi:MAG: gamma-glutamyltransferase family protein [Caulobacteraceae bacterium]|nr:gamma-glutamyltransferase family protein [Caulobacteraceae bacterium]
MKPLIGLLAAAALALAGAAGAAPLAPHAIVVAANPLAAEAGLKVLRRGGSAVDAAVAAQAVLGLVEPQSSGLGGGAFMVYYEARTRRITAYDGRETAPAGASPNLFIGPNGKPLPRAEAILSGRSAGVPGAVAMLSLAHKEHGRLAWRGLFDDAEVLAVRGFTVSPRLASMITSRAPQASAPDAVSYFSKPDGTRLKAGDVLVNRAYAATLRRLAAQGPGALLSGPIAADIVRRLRQDPLPGPMTLADLAAYRPREAPALCAPYRAYIVCGPDAPSGGPAVLEALGLLEHTDIAARGPADPQAWRALAGAERLMYADRDAYEGDPAFVDVPTRGLLDPNYLAGRAGFVDAAALLAPPPGRPPGAPATGSCDAGDAGTSHMVIVDTRGDVVSMTTTVESIFGDGRMVDGFFLNNQLTDFCFVPEDRRGLPTANAVAPGKRPRSSMSPVIVLDKDRRFVAALGSPGGNAIPAYVLKSMIAVLDWGQSMQAATALPNLIARGATTQAEPKLFPPGVVDGLTAGGLALSTGYAAEGSGVHGVVARPGGLEGGADPRREGVAVGF